MGKLTLSVDDRLIKVAKEWTRTRGVSISQIVSKFFVSIGRSSNLPDEMPPVLRRLIGILEDHEMALEEYHRHLEEKYL
jgi:hypothetical protein